MYSYSTITSGYRLVDGRYFIIENAGGKIVAIREILFGCGIYPSPIKDVQVKEWQDVMVKLRSTLVGAE